MRVTPTAWNAVLRYGHLAGAEAFAGASERDLGRDAHRGDKGDGRGGGGWREAVLAEVLAELREYALVGESCGDESDQSEPECPRLDGSFNRHPRSCSRRVGGWTWPVCAAHLDLDVAGLLAQE